MAYEKISFRDGAGKPSVQLGVTFRNEDRTPMLETIVSDGIHSMRVVAPVTTDLIADLHNMATYAARDLREWEYAEAQKTPDGGGHA